MSNSSSQLRKKFWISFLLSILFIFVMKFLIGPVTTRQIVDFELAKTAEKALKVKNELIRLGILDLFLRSVYLDFVFLVLYSACFFYGCRFISGLTGNYILRKAGEAFSWLALLAGIADVVENIGMIRIAKSKVFKNWLPELTYDMALMKFSLLIIMLLFMLVCLIIWGIDKVAQRKRQ